MARQSYRLSDNHFCLNVCDEVRQICEPLFQFCDINYFAFSRYYRDGRSIALLSDPALFINIDVVSDVCSAGIGEDGAFAKPGAYIQDQIKDILMPEKSFACLSRDLGFDQHAYIFEHYEAYDDQFCFAVMGKQNKGLNEFYLNNFDLLERFSLYFRDKAERLIDSAANHKIYIPLPDSSNLEPIETIDKSIFLSQIEPKRYYLPTSKGGAYITKKELGVLKELASGFTAKEAAKRLILSPRTVESYFNNIKHKLGCDRKSQVLDLFLKSKLNRQHVVERF